MTVSGFSLNGKSTFSEISGDRGGVHFWKARFLPGLLLFLMAVALGRFAAVSIANEAWYFVVPLALVLPAAVVFIYYPFITIMLWLLVFPYFANGGSTAARYVYTMLHRGMIPAALVIIILWSGIRKRGLVRFGLAELAMLLFLVLGVVNIFLLSQTPAEGLVRFYDRWFVPFCMYGLVRMIAPKEEDLRRLLPVAVITVVAQCGISLLSWYDPGVLPSQWLGREGERTVGTFINPGTYSSTLIFLSLLLFQYAMHSKSGWVRSVYLLAISVAFFGVFFTFSRASWLGAVMVAAGLFFLYPKKLLRYAVAFGIFMLILGATFLVHDFAFASQRLSDKENATGRILTDVRSIRMVLQKPWFGWGYADYDLHARDFPAQIAGIGYKGHYIGSHNGYLTLMVELGLIGFFLFAVPVAWWLILSIKVWRRLPREGIWSRRLLAMLWLLMMDHFIVSNFVDMFTNNVFGATVWWMALGLIANMVYPYVKLSDIATPRLACQTSKAI